MVTINNVNYKTYNKQFIQLYLVYICIIDQKLILIIVVMRKIINCI